MIGSAPRIGIEIGANAVTIVTTGREPVSVTVEYAHPAAADEYSSALRTALANAASSLEARMLRPLPEASAEIVLLPPIIDARLVTLPPLRPAEAAAVLQRDAARYFVGGSGTRAIATHVPKQLAQANEPHPVFAAAAPTAFVDAVHDAVAALGWRVHAITPAHVSWAAAAYAQLADAGEVAVVAAVGETIHVLRLEGSDVLALRRFPAGDIDDVIDALRPLPKALAVFGGVEIGDVLRSHPALADCRFEMFHATSDALAFTPRDPQVEFTTPAMVASQFEHRRTLTGRFALAAAVLLVLTGAVNFWGARREVAAIEARRADLRDEVAPLLVWRDSLLRFEERLNLLEQVDRKPGRLTAALFDIAVLLPADAHLTAFRSKGDTIVISGLSPRAADAIQALRSARSFRNVTLDGAIDRELDAGTTAQERFTVEAVLTPADSTKASRSRKPAIAARRTGS